MVMVLVEGEQFRVKVRLNSMSQPRNTELNVMTQKTIQMFHVH